MSGLGEGNTHASRELNGGMYLKTGDPGLEGGGTYTGTATEGTLQQYENIFGPAGRDIKLDSQRHKRHQRWHLPDSLKGHNQYLTDRVDGLITDATNSPFTKNILPYVYLENPDQKLKWNVYSFDEGIASRVPYEAAARVLPQTKRSFAGYTVRQGLAIAMEHNFMVSAAGRENFKNQLTQLVGSIQMTNDLDVHVALLQAPSYQKHMNEKYYDNTRTTAQVCRQYIDLFGIMQKIPNALDILIEDAKSNLQTWGSQPPTFCLCNSALTVQLTMLPELTNYVTNGPDGAKRLAQGPSLASYRGLQIIPSRKFSMDAGTAPRDLLRRRVRVAEYYRIPWHEDNPKRTYEFYDQSRDTMFSLSWQDLLLKSQMTGSSDDRDDQDTCDDYGTGPWSYETFKNQTLPKYKVKEWNSTSTRLENGMILEGREGIGTTDSVCLITTGFTYSKHADMYSRRRIMSLDEMLADTKDIRKMTSHNKIIAGLSHAGVKLVQETCPPTQEIRVLPQQSELFGRGFFNDPISKTVGQQQRLFTNYDALQDAGVARDFEKHWFIAHAFQILDDMYDHVEFGGKALNDCMQNGTGKPLAITPLADLACLASTSLQPLISLTKNHREMPLHYCFDVCQDLFREVHNPTHLKPVSMTYTRNFELHSGIFQRTMHLLCMDGNLDDLYMNVDLGSVSLQMLLELFRKIYKVCENNVIFLTWLRASASHNVTIPNAVGAPAVMYDLRQANQFASVAEHPNLFFLFILLGDWNTPLFIQGFANQMTLGGEPLLDKEMEILHSFAFGFGNEDTCTHLCELFHEAHLVQQNNCDSDVSQKVDSATVMRGAYSLLRHFDVQVVGINALRNVNANSQKHLLITKMIVLAAYAHCNYRKQVKMCAFQAGQTSSASGIQQTTTILEGTANSCLTTMCKSTFFRLSVVNEAAMTPHAAQYANDIQGTNDGFALDLFNYDPAAGAPMNGLILPHGRVAPGANYWKTITDTFRTHMKEGNASVKRSHNMVMQTSMTAGGNISHFPNFHISRCDPLQETDRNKSASSNDESTWILQQLAGMTVLSKAVCAKMMGIQSLPDIVIQQCYELLNSGLQDVDKPTIYRIGARANVAAVGTEYNGNASYFTSNGQPRASDQFNTNLMIAIMSHFHPSAYVRTETSSLAFVPVHVQSLVMNAFADAISQNKTNTPELDKALSELFVKTDSHVPFCEAAASKTFTMTPRTHETPEEYKKLVQQPVTWDNVPIMQGEAGVPPAEIGDVGRNARLMYNLVWDPYKGECGAAKASSIVNEGARRQLREMHPLRSFSPASINGEEASPEDGRIHTGLERAAASAEAFCRDPANWNAFYGHVLLVWMARFFKATSRFVDNGSGMMAVSELDNKVKYIANGMHFMHGSQLPVQGKDPNIRSEEKTACDIVILRPNIEHEMLGVIMGRGGTQELGATFWGQTELSCYDDSQHGIWGMSYKYHERAMVTNERNLIRVYDVAFDGYNGGLDQSCVDWNDAPSRKSYRDNTYDRSKPYSGPSMLVMALPLSSCKQVWPNPIVFHGSIASSYCPDPEKSQGALPNLAEHMVFNHDKNPRGCTLPVQERFSQYMAKLQMTQWANVDQSSQPAGESCVANETTSSPMAFQGSMRVMQGGNIVDEIKGSGHLGHSYVGVASVREGRGVLNPAGQHGMMRLV